MKQILKKIKLNESNISLALGIGVVIIVAFLIVKYLKTNNGNVPADQTINQNFIESTSKTHKVVKGENLWKLAVEYYGDGFKWVDIATENKLANASVLEVDQELIIPQLDNISSSEDSVIDKINTTSPEYTVQKGDSLWNIAVKVYNDGYMWTKIADSNKLTNPNLIFSGNILVLPR